MIAAPESGPTPSEEVVEALRRLERERIPLLRRLQELEERRMRILQLDTCTRRRCDPVASRRERARLMFGSTKT